MSAAVTVEEFRSPVSKRAQTRRIAPGKTLADIAPDSSLPVLCKVNGEYILHQDWDAVELEDGDVVQFQSIVQGGGGGGSDVLRIVLTVAVLVAAYYAAPAVLGALSGGTGVIGGLTAAQSLSLVTVGLITAGNLLVNALLPMPKPGSFGQSESQSSSYSVNVAGNQAKLGDVIPVIYGSHQTYPDFAAQPYSEYDNTPLTSGKNRGKPGNDQYYFALFCIGMGKYKIDTAKDIFIDDTLLSHFEDVDCKILQPGQMPTMVNPAVVGALEVSGQELLHGKYTGPFSLTAPGLDVNKIGIDVAFPRGLGATRDDGSVDEMHVAWTVEIRKVNQKGIAQGPWQLIGSESYADDRIEPLRRSYTYDVPSGRYEIRLQRQNVVEEDTRKPNAISWIAARGYLTKPATLNKNATYMEVKIRANEQLNGTSQRRFSVNVRRLLPTWSPTGGWSAPVETRSIAWALADILRNNVYGAATPDRRIDLDTLYALDQIWHPRKDFFDFVFDTRVTAWAALDQVAKCGRATRFQRGGVYTFSRDQKQLAPVAIYMPRNINKGSMKVEFLIPGENRPDGLEITYYDRDTWQFQYMTEPGIGVKLDDVTQPQEFSLPGITVDEHILREARYMIAADRYRRKIITFSTELEGMIPTFGDLVGVAHDAIKWGKVTGEVVEYVSDTVLRLSEPLDWTESGVQHISFTNKWGEYDGPYEATPGVDEYEVILDPAIDPDDFHFGEDGAESAKFIFGTVDKSYMRMARVLAMRPNSTSVELMVIMEDDRVHDADQYVPGPEGPDLPITVFYAPTDIPSYLAADPEDQAKYGFYADTDGTIAGGELPGKPYQPTPED